MSEHTSFALYEAYGKRPYEWGTDDDRQKANTKEEETDLELLNEGMRYRDLETGTFITRDPIGFADGPNVYCYVHCNPIMKFDAWGLSAQEDAAAAAEAARIAAEEAEAARIAAEEAQAELEAAQAAKDEATAAYEKDPTTEGMKDVFDAIDTQCAAEINANSKAADLADKVEKLNKAQKTADSLSDSANAKTHSTSIGGAIYLVGAVKAELAVARDTNGNKGIILTVGGGVGVGAKAKSVPGLNYSIKDGDLSSQAGADESTTVGVIVGIDVDNDSNITGGNLGTIGGGHTWDYSWVIPFPGNSE